MTTRERKLTPVQIMELGNADPVTNYLVRVEGQPFLVTLRDYAAGSLGQSVSGYLEHRLDADPGHRADVAAAIEQFCAEYRLQKCWSPPGLSAMTKPA